MKRIKELFPNIETEDFKVLSIACDSRYASKDCIFFCVDGLTVDGHKYIDDAIFLGAKCIVYSKPLTYKNPKVLYIKVDNVLDELNRVADLFYDYPSRKMSVIGISGTSGKTMISSMIQHILSQYLKMGYIGPNVVQYEGVYNNTKSKTLDTVEIQRSLMSMVKRECKGVVVEIPTMSLSLKRTDSIHFNIALFTNTYDDHIGNHGTFENILRSESRLLTLLDEHGCAVLNADDVKLTHYLGELNQKVITYGIDHICDLKAYNIKYDITHTEFDIIYLDESYHVYSPFISKENVSNILAVIATLIALDLPIHDILNSIANLPQIEGRYELVNLNAPYHCIVDYCQYKSNYESLFKFIKSHTKGRVVVVCGAPLKKEYIKRKLLGELLDQYSDYVVLTEQDFVSDKTLKVCESIQDYLTHTLSIVITDRRIAIEQALNNLSNDDTLLILGKGNEKSFNSENGIVPYPGDSYVLKQTFNHLHD